MLYIPKKSREIYNYTIAHRGYHAVSPENSLKAFSDAIKFNMAIETDIRSTRDGVIVCYHDRYLRKHLNIRGKISEYTYKEINNLYINNTSEKVPTLEELLKLVDGRVVLLIEIKGYIDKKFKNKLCKLLENYNGKVYFHAKNIFTFFYYKKIFGDKVFFVLNPLRKRFDFVKIKKAPIKK